MDFFPLPKSGPYRFYNRFFYLIDRYCLYNADWIFFTTEGHIKGREQYKYFNRNDVKEKIKMIPLGMDSKRAVSYKITENNKFSLLYCGVVSKYQMLELIFKVVKKLKEKYPLIRLDIVGKGPDFEYYKNLSLKEKLDKFIVFHGFLEEGEDFGRFMGNHLLGFALYQNVNDYIRYTEPAKVKYYLSFGVPAVISRVPLIAEDFHRRRLSFAVKNNVEEIYLTIENFLSNEKLQNEFKNNISRFVGRVDINLLLDNVFEGVI